jgi:hypothetical protein
MSVALKGRYSCTEASATLQAAPFCATFTQAGGLG